MNCCSRFPAGPALTTPAVARALGGWTLHDGRTLFEGVRRLGAGHLVGLGGGDFSGRRYWRPQPPAPSRLGREEAVEEVRRLVAAAVLRRVGPGTRRASCSAAGWIRARWPALARQRSPGGGCG